MKMMCSLIASMASELDTPAPPNSCHLAIEDLNHHMDHNAQIDMMLDFSKTFDTVQHCCLLKKLKFYHIESNIICWIEKWLKAP